MDWRTRQETAQDIDAVHAVVTAAFDRHDEAALVDALRADPAWLPGLSWVATADDGTVVGHALLTRCRIGTADALALAPVAVLPAHHSRGAGSAVVRAALDAARSRGERIVVVLGHPEYYRRFGFVPASRYGISTAFDVPDEALMALPLAGAPPGPGVLRYAAPFGV